MLCLLLMTELSPLMSVSVFVLSLCLFTHYSVFTACTKWSFIKILICYALYGILRDSVVVKILCYKLACCGFETRWGETVFSIYLILAAALGPGVHSVSNRNEYQKQENNVPGE
jgi:hypothetical protein